MSSTLNEFVPAVELLGSKLIWMKEHSMWKRLDETKLKNVGGDEDVLAIRVYGQDGKPWPRLVMKVSDHSWVPNGDLLLSCSYKERGEWWDEASIPRELLSDLIEMLEETKAKLQ